MVEVYFSWSKGSTSLQNRAAPLQGEHKDVRQDLDLVGRDEESDKQRQSVPDDIEPLVRRERLHVLEAADGLLGSKSSARGPQRRFHRGVSDDCVPGLGG